ncbi:hypothetical protein FHX74_001274 [Friedmanniella endophytica]|uniref:Uncharacterized protein n=1 Tax=Microlunatus kandeliicorticis TaxID=1759536 RepID=A0A7W3IR06_9ACTN|nr:hypothetical protein [Microlunatus kandeliicorticis]MBA8793669.1 hypothetical protein [Microlunatus kandeliicorticis]
MKFPSGVKTGILIASVYLVGVILTYVFSALSRTLGVLLDYRILIAVLAVAVVVLVSFLGATALFWVGVLLGVSVTALIVIFVRSLLISKTAQGADRLEQPVSEEPSRNEDVEPGIGPTAALSTTAQDEGSDSVGATAQQESPMTLQDLLGDVSEALRFVGLTVLEGLRTLAYSWSNERAERLYFLKQDAERRVQRSPFMSREIVDTMSLAGSADALDFLNAKFPPEDSEDLLSTMSSADSDWLRNHITGIEQNQNAAKRPWRRLYREARTAHYVPRRDVETYVKESLLGVLAGSSEARREFVWRYVVVALPPEQIDRRISELKVRLKVDHEKLYDEYDRLSAEAEFRSAIGIPMAATLIFVGYAQVQTFSWLTFDQWWPTVDRLLNVQALPSWLYWLPEACREILHQPFWAFVIGVVIMILFSSAGKAKAGEAARLLYAAVRQGILSKADEPLFDSSELGFDQGGVLGVRPEGREPAETAPMMTEPTSQ